MNHFVKLTVQELDTNGVLRNYKARIRADQIRCLIDSSLTLNNKTGVHNYPVTFVWFKGGIDLRIPVKENIDECEKLIEMTLDIRK